MTTDSAQDIFVATDALVGERVVLGPGTRIWNLVQVREDATIGENSIVGRGAYIGRGVVLGANCKVQNDALIYEPAVLGDGVFIGPAAVLTNDLFPRAINPHGDLKEPADWNPVGVVIEAGASIGARAVCVAPLRVGEWAMVAAGAVVTHDVKPFSLVMGVPARHAGWVGRAGVPLVGASGSYRCPATGEKYQEVNENLEFVGASQP
jgi:acetyltransferase-like isoleucine patch superfamily enzyme